MVEPKEFVSAGKKNDFLRLHSPIITHTTPLVALRAGLSPMVELFTHLLEPRILVALWTISWILVQRLSDFGLQSSHSEKMHRYQFFWGNRPRQYFISRNQSIVNSRIEFNINERVCRGER